MNQIEHNQLIFIAARLGAEFRECCKESESICNGSMALCRFQDQKLADLICERCKMGFTSTVWSVHDHGQCVITQDEKDHQCLISRYQERMLGGEHGFTRPYRNNVTPVECDYLVFVAARMTNDLSVCDLEFRQLAYQICSLCKSGARAWLPDVHAGNCLGGCHDIEDQQELAKKCWVGRMDLWLIDGDRLSRVIEYV